VSTNQENHIGIIGLGYVGLPLAIEFAKVVKVSGFDTNHARIAELKSNKDSSLEVTSEDLENANNISYTANPDELKPCNIYIVTVPTPIDIHKRPDLSPLISACKTVGPLLSKNNIVIFESTVYPGCTEETCVPELEAASGLTFNQDFFVGYSPERINPGDKEHRLTTITKVTAGSTPESATEVDELYRKIITAGTHKTSSIRVAEAAKVIENTQRDLNIALINELALIFNRLDIDTIEVLEAAGSKWNFLPFRPGLVGGHCIGVDPYYLTHKAQEIGYHPEVILAGRRINDNMGNYIAENVIKLMIQREINIASSNILVMGLTFKEDCPDLRNTRVVDIIAELESYHAKVHVYDPWVNKDEAKREYQVAPIQSLENGKYDAIVLAVSHQQFKEMSIETIRALGTKNCIVYDVKSLFPYNEVDGRL